MRGFLRTATLAEGEKDQRIREADGYRLKRINEAEGDVARFSALLAEYNQGAGGHPPSHLYRDLQDVMPGMRSKIIVDERTRSIVPLLNLDSQKGDRP
jgi:modulator of FtsH protease HflK